MTKHGVRPRDRRGESGIALEKVKADLVKRGTA
jgi:hypothetical protein